MKSNPNNSFLRNYSKLTPESDTDLGLVPDYECPGEFSVASHETKCDLYYLCAAGESNAHLYQCRVDQLFDVNIRGCIVEDAVDCGDRLRPYNCTLPNGNFPISPNACESRYYICVDNVYTLEVKNSFTKEKKSGNLTLHLSKVCKNGSIFDATTGNCSTTAACLASSKTF